MTFSVHAAVLLGLASIPLVTGSPATDSSKLDTEPIEISLSEIDDDRLPLPARDLQRFSAPPQATDSIPQFKLPSPSFHSMAIEDTRDATFPIAEDDAEPFGMGWPQKADKARAKPAKSARVARATPTVEPVKRPPTKPRERPKSITRTSGFLTHSPKPVYPKSAKRRSLEGTVQISATVSSAGRVTAMAIAKSSGYASLDEAARRALGRWKFRPATLGGVATATTVVVPIRFALD